MDGWQIRRELEARGWTLAAWKEKVAKIGAANEPAADHEFGRQRSRHPAHQPKDVEVIQEGLNMGLTVAVIAQHLGVSRQCVHDKVQRYGLTKRCFCGTPIPVSDRTCGPHRPDLKRLCGCGAKVEPRKHMCETCRRERRVLHNEKLKAFLRERNRQRREAGLCAQCGEVKSETWCCRGCQRPH